MASTLLASACAGAAILAALIQWFRRPSAANDDVSNLPGPPSSSWIFGNMRELALSPQYGAHEFEWLRTSGPVYRIKGCFGQNRLMVADPVAIAHILNSTNFEHTQEFENKMYMVEGPTSISYVKGAAHGRLRAAMYPAFSASAVANYHPALDTVAAELVKQLEAAAAAANATVDVCPILGQATLGAVCRGVFGISTQDLDPALLANTAQLGAIAPKTSDGSLLSDALSAHIPPWVLAYLPLKPFSVLARGRALKTALGMRVVREQRNGGSGNVYAAMLSSDAARNLSDDALAGQVGRFMVAGTQSATNALSFALLELAKDPSLQQSLRAELLAAGDPPEYDTLPILNSLIKEVLRVYAGVPLSDRLAIRDDVIPTTDGKAISVGKGQVVTIATASYRRLVSRWGDRADGFDTTRWAVKSNNAEAQGSFGPFADLGTFLGGNRSCVGWRFAILELQIFLATLVRQIAFTLPAGHVSAHAQSFVETRLMGTLSPIVAESGRRGVPLVVKRLELV